MLIGPRGADQWAVGRSNYLLSSVPRGVHTAPPGVYRRLAELLQDERPRSARPDVDKDGGATRWPAAPHGSDSLTTALALLLLMLIGLTGDSGLINVYATS